MNALTAAMRDALMQKSREMSDQATISIRNADAQAYGRMKAGKVAYDPSEADRKEWTDVFVKVCKGLRGSVFTPAVFDKIVQIAQPPIQL
jgi:hypothetical protein